MLTRSLNDRQVTDLFTFLSEIRLRYSFCCREKSFAYKKSYILEHLEIVNEDEGKGLG